jgi:UDP-N-acetylglucosamine--N-acetylmuramyl-(pentapeptide) pyrophosphoryl-undecaprenol N-acetylglucosamine transferase
MIAGGGTGGHIYPALTIAKAIQQLNKNWEVEFVGTPDGLESKIIPKEGFKINFISVGKLNYSGSFFKKILTLFRLPWGFIKCLALIIEKKPVLVLGVGGYASGPFVLASSIMGVPTALWEPNAHPGLTNRILARFVRKCFIVFDDAKKNLKARSFMTVGIPVREEIEKLQLADSVPHDNFRVLVFGGSQGARAINNTVKEMILNNKWDNVEFVHQTGVNDYQEVNEAYKNLSFVKAHEYLYQMDQNYIWADLVICRAGAGTVAEIAAAKKTAIFIPLPSAADDHQKKNAEALVKQNAGFMIEQKDLSAEVLYKKVLELKNNVELRKTTSQNVRAFFQPQAAQKMAEQIVNLQYENEE